MTDLLLKAQHPFLSPKTVVNCHLVFFCIFFVSMCYSSLMKFHEDILQLLKNCSFWNRMCKESGLLCQQHFEVIWSINHHAQQLLLSMSSVLAVVKNFSLFSVIQFFHIYFHWLLLSSSTFPNSAFLLPEWWGSMGTLHKISLLTQNISGH